MAPMIEAILLSAKRSPIRIRRVKDESPDSFVFGYRVIDKNGPVELDMLEFARRKIFELPAAAGQCRVSVHQSGPMIVWWVPAIPGISVRAAIMVTLGEEVAGGMIAGTSYVHPSFRGLGIGAEIVIAAHEYGVASPSHFSRSGQRARISAMRISVERAMDASESINPKMLEWYEKGSYR